MNLVRYFSILLFFSIVLPLQAQAVTGLADNFKPRKPTLADLDQDSLSDSLQARLETAHPQDLFDVVVTFVTPENAGFARNLIGPFQLKREFRRIRGFAGKLTAAQARALARSPRVFRVEEDFVISINLDSANADFGNAAARIDYGVDGTGVAICVIDTGVDPGHEQLDASKVFAFIDYVTSCISPCDDHGHGTHVTSIAAGDGTGGLSASTFMGVAPGADIAAAKALDSLGFGVESDAIAGIEWCMDQPGVRIISMSLSSEVGSDGFEALALSANAAVDAGFVVVAAAGNSGAEPGTMGSPAVADKVIAVGSVAEWSAHPALPRHSDGIFLAATSGRGPTSAPLTKPDITAPGVTISAAEAGTVSDYVTFTGTSMATPHVSGTIALALEAEPTLTPTVIRNLIEVTAQDRGAPGKDNEWGAGLLDGHAVVGVAAGASMIEPTDFQTYVRVQGTVADSGLWTYNFNVAATDLSIPIGATITVEGVKNCLVEIFGICLLAQWDPDLDAKLFDPLNNELVFSGCTGVGTECGLAGRQETVSSMPTVAGTYRIEVEPFSGDPNFGKGGDFALDLSTGPMVALSSYAMPDADSDGLIDLYETNTGTFATPTDTGTDPFNADTDGDGITDGDEVNAGSDPNVSFIPALSPWGVGLFLFLLGGGFLLKGGRRASG